MKTLEPAFTALQWSGLWRPVHWNIGWKSKLYDIYSAFAVFILISFMLVQCIEIAKSITDIAATAENSFLMFCLLADVGKSANVLMKRNRIIEWTNRLQEGICRPRNETELAIQSKFDEMGRYNLVRFATTTCITAALIILKSLVEDIPQRSLPINAWLPFEHHESLLGYWVAYIHQMFGLVISSGVGISFDTFVPALMMQICAQLNILKHRLIEVPHRLRDMIGDSENEEQLDLFTQNAESELLSLQVQHHIEIFKFGEELNDLFGLMIFLQYSCSTMIICVSLLLVSRMELFSPEFTVLFIYIAEMAVQIVMYCFYGGEVTIESINLCDGIYEMDWTDLSVVSKRSLLTMMIRTTRPITFSTGSILTMNLESFKSLLKLSYSTFNVLQTQT